MAFSWFLKLAFKCVDHFAWPLLALGYPLCASVQAIETDSYEETRDLISYWILLSLIYLFEYAFMRLLQWLQFWPYIKLMIILWLIIPYFRRASYVYNNLIRACICTKPQIVTCRLNNYRRNVFVEKDHFLLHAERYMKENGTEALEKLIASKNSVCKPDAEATNAVRASVIKEMQLTNGKILQTEHRGIKDWEAVEKKEIPASKQDIPVMPNLVPSQNASSAMMENKGILGKLAHKEVQKQDIPVMPNLVPSQNASSAMMENKGILGKLAHKEVQKQDIPVMPNLVPSQNASSAMMENKGILGKLAHKEVQIEWTCAMCQVTTTCEKTLNSHLKGRRHRATCEALKAKKQPTLQKVKISQQKEELKQKNGINQQNSNAKNANNRLKGTVAMDHKVQKPQKNLSELVRMKGSKFKCVVCDVILESEANVACHFNGKKHLANIPK